LLGLTLRYPSYREGAPACLEAEDAVLGEPGRRGPPPDRIAGARSVRGPAGRRIIWESPPRLCVRPKAGPGRRRPGPGPETPRVTGSSGWGRKVAVAPGAELGAAPETRPSRCPLQQGLTRPPRK
jgi:hypothetical protein